jgi:hypothetical protein
MRTSPLYALGDVFRHCACSSIQIVNMLHQRVGEALRAAHRPESLSLAGLRFNKEVLDNHAAWYSIVFCTVREEMDFSGIATWYWWWLVLTCDSNAVRIRSF